LSDLDEEMQAMHARKPYRLERPSVTMPGRWLYISGKPLFSENGTFVGYRGATTDITERKRAEAALQKARDELEFRVDERTAELREINETLRNEIAKRETAVGTLHGLSARLISAQEDERSRIARELHDDFNQRLALLAVDLERFHDGLPGTQEGLVDGLASLLRRTKELSSDVHRLSHQLHPSVLQHLGLVAAARSFCKEISEQHDVHIELAHHEVPRSLPSDIALCLYRIVQEALRNVIKHSGAKSARIEIIKMESELKLHISDNGIGFDPESDRPRCGLGLLSMRERLRQVDGTISFMRIEPTGTRIDVCIPFSESSQP
jgi:signal transduction histidine kinase